MSLKKVSQKISKKFSFKKLLFLSFLPLSLLNKSNLISQTTVNANLDEQSQVSNLSFINKLKHHKISSDTVEVENHSELAKKYIHPKVLNQSNYYKNLLVKIKDLKEIV